MATNPDKIFAKLLLAKPLTAAQRAEVNSWLDAREPDKMVAWIFANLHNLNRRQRVTKIIAHILGFSNVKAKLGVLVILIYAPSNVLNNKAIQEAIYSCFDEAAIRQNSTQVLARLSKMGFGRAKKLLKQKMTPILLCAKMRRRCLRDQKWFNHAGKTDNAQLSPDPLRVNLSGHD